MTMTLVKLSYNSKLVPDPGLVLQTPLWPANFWPKNVQKCSPHLGFEPAPSREQKNE